MAMAKGMTYTLHKPLPRPISILHPVYDAAKIFPPFNNT